MVNLIFQLQVSPGPIEDLTLELLLLLLLHYTLHRPLQLQTASTSLSRVSASIANRSLPATINRQASERASGQARQDRIALHASDPASSVIVADAMQPVVVVVAAPPGDVVTSVCGVETTKKAKTGF